MSRAKLTPVSPVLPVAPYIGGKRVLAKRIISRIEAVPHTSYCEPFVGLGGVFLRRPSRPKAEAINDISGDVTTLFRILQRHYPQFMDTLKYQLTSRREFERLRDTNPETLTDLERAARFLYLQRTAFGGKVSGRNFAMVKDRGARFNLLTLASTLEDVHERLSGVMIECLPWAEFIRRYDRKGALFFLDPPYCGNERDYGEGVFGREDFALMAEVLAGLKGRFILTINDHPHIREVFSGFDIEGEAVTYTLAASGAGSFKELVISG